jgi:hypothetical protein
LISLWLCLAFSCKTVPTAAPSPVQLFDPATTATFRLKIRTASAEVTGILVVKGDGDRWRGSLINEFGVKAFDFTLSGRKCRLLNVAPYLDKWYIRRTIAADFSYIFNYSPNGRERRGKRLEATDGNAFTMTNTRRKIEYTFQYFNQ